MQNTAANTEKSSSSAPASMSIGIKASSSQEAALSRPPTRQSLQPKRIGPFAYRSERRNEKKPAETGGPLLEHQLKLMCPSFSAFQSAPIRETFTVYHGESRKSIGRITTAPGFFRGLFFCTGPLLRPFFLPCLSWRGFSCCPSVGLSAAF